MTDPYHTRSENSNSSRKAYRECEVKWWAVNVEHTHTITPTDDMLAGSLVHCMALEPDKLDEFREAHPEIWTKGSKNVKPRLREKFAAAERTAEAMLANPMLADLLDGVREIVYTGTIAGVPWRGKLDCISVERQRIVDLKKVPSVDGEVWVPNRQLPWVVRRGEYLPVVEARGIHYQLGLYRELVEQRRIEIRELVCIAYTLQDPPAFRVYIVNNEAKLAQAMEDLTQTGIEMERLKAHGGMGLLACGSCEVCRSMGIVETEEI